MIYSENQSAIHIAENSLFHERTKHIDIDYHVVREKLQSKVISLLAVRSSHPVADCFTKPLSADSFRANIAKLNSLNIYNLA